MILYPPLYKTNRGIPRDVGSLLGFRSQGFGENVSYYSDTTIWPRPTNGHPGIDWPCTTGTEIYSPLNGTVKSLAVDYRTGAGFGAGVILKCVEGEVLLWHLSRIDVSVGQAVKIGDIIGLSGNSGVSSNPHLHLEWRPYPIQYNNDFWGAADPAPILAWRALPTTDIMTEKEVRQLQSLEGYRDEDGVAFWTGKKLADYLAARLADKIKTIQESQ